MIMNNTTTSVTALAEDAESANPPPSTRPAPERKPGASAIEETIKMNDRPEYATPELDSDAIWNSVFGPYETRQSILRMCEDQRLAPQDFIAEAIRVAVGKGFTCDRSVAFASLCKQLDVVVV